MAYPSPPGGVGVARKGGRPLVQCAIYGGRKLDRRTEGVKYPPTGRELTCDLSLERCYAAKALLHGNGFVSILRVG